MSGLVHNTAWQGTTCAVIPILIFNFIKKIKGFLEMAMGNGGWFNALL
jgi:hypothetical protein